jgi:hypothetical protein
MKDLTNMRKLFFIASSLTALLSAVGVYIDWTIPFPLVRHSDGSLSINPWDNRVLEIGLIFCLATIALASFGRGRARWFLIAAGMLLFVFSLIGYLQNHV